MGMTMKSNINPTTAHRTSLIHADRAEQSSKGATSQGKRERKYIRLSWRRYCDDVTMQGMGVNILILTFGEKEPSPIRQMAARGGF